MINVSALQSIANTSTLQPSQASSASNNGQSFGAVLGDALNQLNQQQNTVNQLNDQFVSGQITDVHQLMLASTKASLGLELAVQIRDKAISAYQDIMRMSI
ncbi:MAG: flagellar hook-basal body complex protein FliE [Paenibacillus sp. RIFOXYA1_FULL_44_5]|nr:MAG: flagellar hook-basal body complex protein FliE [Paenibacillus sp. RIFOXYA1_FULL_44_5]